MLSVIVGIHNQFAMNQLFWQYLSANTEGEWELIVVDNASTDQSVDFFKSVGAKVIQNHGNFSYPYTQNRGIEVAKGHFIAFLNNDVIVPPSWNQKLINSLQLHQLDVITACGIEKIESQKATKQLRRRWRLIKNLVLLFAGRRILSLKLMHFLMYPRWAFFCQQRALEHLEKIKIGFVGNTVLMTRRALELVGPWDERIQAADFDLFLRVQERHKLQGDIKPVHIALDVFVHHYIRLTEGIKYPPYQDRDNLIELSQKWGPEKITELTSQLNS